MTSNPASVGPAPDGLLPCPFDGEPAVVREAMGDHWIACECCDATSAMRGRLADAIAAWNTRAPHPDREAEPTGDDDVRAALDLALVILGEAEPGDSRAVSNEYVAMASAGTPHHNDEARKIIRDRLQALSVSPPVVEGALRASPCVPTEGHEAAVIDHMVSRFLAWRLPENFNPDNGISFKPTFNDHMNPPMRCNPVGTNLFDRSQAEAMVRHMLEGLPL